MTRAVIAASPLQALARVGRRGGVLHRVTRMHHYADRHESDQRQETLVPPQCCGDWREDRWGSRGVGPKGQRALLGPPCHPFAPIWRHRSDMSTDNTVHRVYHISTSCETFGGGQLWHVLGVGRAVYLGAIRLTGRSGAEVAGGDCGTRGDDAQAVTGWRRWSSLWCPAGVVVGDAGLVRLRRCCWSAGHEIS